MPRKKESENFVCVYNGYLQAGADDEDSAVRRAADVLRRDPSREILIYRLVKKVKTKPAPVEVSAVSF
jgi:hypothetical protein